VHPPSGCHFNPRCPYAMPVCRSLDPELLASGPGHLVACHLPVVEKRLTWRQIRPGKAVSA
jgi:ABC-type dipeptide/oligopeptide/nickel transport system ATPase component